MSSSSIASFSAPSTTMFTSASASTTASTLHSSTTMFPMPSHTAAPDNSTNPTSSPLLFFVALGFGVVFTNLWIIVGVKYCFRYNTRNRQLREAAENGEPIDLANINGRPHRRRREKKLMSMEEVNERFPLIKYKLWRATREQEGLPAAGGVTAPSSRAPSIRNSAGLARALKSDDTSDDKATETSKSTSAIGETKDFANPTSQSQSESELAASSNTKEQSTHLESTAPAAEYYQVHLGDDAPASPSTVSRSATVEDADDEDDPIRNAVPTELLAHPGDACAICIDNLDDDDEVRGLTCGHAFHAGCLDPWLTSRRACCPLCKADYYVPKPRPEGEQAADGSNTRRTTVPEPPMAIWLGARGGVPFRSRNPMLVRPLVFDSFDRYGLINRSRTERQQSRSNTQTAEETTAANAITPSWRTRARHPFHHAHSPPTMPSLALPNFFRRSRETPAPTSDEATPNASTATPSQLEAGPR